MAVTALEIKTCSPFAQGIAFGDVGSYQQLDGTVHFAVDPGHPSNAGIADLQLAPVNGQVHVHSISTVFNGVQAGFDQRESRLSRRALLDTMTCQQTIQGVHCTQLGIAGCGQAQDYFIRLGHCPHEGQGSTVRPS